jgi:hypothetical protein
VQCELLAGELSVFLFVRRYCTRRGKDGNRIALAFAQCSAHSFGVIGGLGLSMIGKP